MKWKIPCFPENKTQWVLFSGKHGLYKEEGWGKGVLTKEKKGLFLDQDVFWREENGKGFCHSQMSLIVYYLS